MDEYYFKIIGNKTIETLVLNVLEELKRREPENRFSRYATGTYHIKTNCYEVLDALADFGYIKNLEETPKIYL